MTDKKVEYIPPSDEIIDDYARRVCEAAEIDDKQVRFGFASFLKFSSKLLAKQMNEQHNQENNEV